MQFDKDKRVRSVVYAVSDDNERMTSLAHTGRDQQPQSFERGTHRGNLAFKTLASGEPLFVPDLGDLKEENPKKWSGSGEGYATFITVPIGDARGGYGLLTVDAPEAGTFDETDAYFVQVLAKMMGLAYAARASSLPSSEPRARVDQERKG